MPDNIDNFLQAAQPNDRWERERNQFEDWAQRMRQQAIDDERIRMAAGIAWPPQNQALPPWARPAAEDMPIDPAAQVAAVNQQFVDTETSDLKESLMKPKTKKEKKVPKPIEYTDEQKAEAKVRVSIFGNTFPESVPEQWQEYEGIGWSHCSELSRFLDSYKQCFYSKKYFPLNKLSRTVGGYAISSDEIKKNGWVKCQHSEYWTTKDSLVDAYSGNKKIKIDRRFIDDGSYFMCGLSQKYYGRNSRVQVRNSERYNYVAREEIAKSEEIRKCEVCGNFFDNAVIQIRDFGPDRPRTMACASCYNRETARSLIRAHNFAEYPAPIYKKIEYYRMKGAYDNRKFTKVEDVGIRLFGVEVETEMSKNACVRAGIDRLALAREVKDTLGSDFVMIKEDGSLSLNGHYADGRNGTLYAGFEIVSAPADIAVHRDRWQALEKMKHFGVLRAWDTDTCGLHVHVSKDALTTLQIGRILMMMTHKNNKKFVAKVAGRSETKYCKAFHKDKFSEGIQYGEAEVRNGVEYIQASFHMPRSDDARRQAVNITNPRTIEFRIFRGTVHPRHIIRNIEFCDAVCSFCHPGSRSLQELADWHNLVHYIAENRKAYPLLTEWMENPDVGLLPYRENAYGPKDTRGTKRPDVVETIHVKTQPEELVAVDPIFGIPIPAGVNIQVPAPALRPMRFADLAQARPRPINEEEARREQRRVRRRERAEQAAVAAAALAPLGANEAAPPVAPAPEAVRVQFVHVPGEDEEEAPEPMEDEDDNF